MKAVRMHSHGGPEVLAYEDVPEPEAGFGEVLIRVRACAMNHLDVWTRKGIPGIRLPHIPGSDGAGEVVAVGPGCSRVKAGARVLVAPGLSCRQCIECFSGRDNRCPRYGLLGAPHPGTNREVMNVPEYAVVEIPDSISFEQAAATPLVFMTAWHMLMGRAQLRPFEDVLVLAASSGVGQAAVQIAKLLHCRVIATAGGEQKCARAAELGADHVVDHYAGNIVAEVKRVTGGRGVDVVFEHVGEATWTHSMASLARGGRLVTCGATTGFAAAVDLRHLFAKHYSVNGSFMGSLADLHTVLKPVFAGKIHPVVDRVFPLSAVAEAHRYLETKQQFGKVILAL